MTDYTIFPLCKTCLERIADKIKHTHSVLIHYAQLLNHHKIADLLRDACFYAQFPVEYMNIETQARDYFDDSEKLIRKTLSMMQIISKNLSETSDKLFEFKDYSRPLIIDIQTGIKKQQPSANLRRKSIFSAFNYKPVSSVICKVNFESSYIDAFISQIFMLSDSISKS